MPTQRCPESPSHHREVRRRPCGQHARLLHTRLGLLHAGYFKNHCSLRRGSIGTSARWLKPTLFSIRLLFHQARRVRVSFSTATLRASKRSRPDELSPASVVHRAVGIHDVHDRGELVALADFEVGLVVRGRHLKHARAELEIHVLVADDRDELLFARQSRRAADGRRACR